MRMLDKMRDFFTGQEDYDDGEEMIEVEEEEIEEPIQRPRQMPPVQQTHAKIVPMINKPQHTKMEILNFTMNSYEMTGEICNYIKSHKPVIVNMQYLEPAQVQRAVDYLTGASYALNGAVERIADNIFLFAPEDVHITPDQMKTKAAWPMV